MSIYDLMQMKIEKLGENFYQCKIGEAYIYFESYEYRGRLLGFNMKGREIFHFSLAKYDQTVVLDKVIKKLEEAVR